ncbi:MAG: hypothetical protein JJ896_07135 [Rhodothermales bacterium]|nr:hypothetical protein [Rhodothermales bacterium]MBO6779411.1 hypothetical protein [Rhodothermales bacterium]
MTTYTAYGLVVQSDLALPFSLAPTGTTGQVTVRAGRFHVPRMKRDGPLSFRLDDEFWYFQWPGEATYRMATDEVVVMLDGDPAAAGERLSGQLMGLFLRRAGRIVLHGNVVSRHGLAICLLGATGMGKTTLTGALLATGWAFLSDDLCVLEEGTGGWSVQPGPGRLKVRAGGPLKQLERVTPSASGATLKGIAVLEAGGPVVLEPLAGPEALLELIRHAHMPRSLDVSGLADAHLQRVGGLAGAIPIGRLRRGSTLTDLPQVVEILDRMIQ